jgi:arylsulfatase
VDRGFDRSYSLVTGGSNYFRIDPTQLAPILARDDQRITPGKDWYITDAITDNAVAFLREHNGSEAPFFLYVAYTAPHWPLHAHRQDIAKYRGTYQLGWDTVRRRRYERLLQQGIIQPRWPLSPRDPSVPPWEEAKDKDRWDLKMAVYAAQIDRMDQGVGKILAQLREVGREQDTLVLFLSDNGASAEVIDRGKPGAPAGDADSFLSYGVGWANASNTPFRLHKHLVHEGGIATPLIATWPAVIRNGGRVTHQPGHVMDLLPTCLDLGGVGYPKTYRGHAIIPLEGKSLVPILENGVRPEHDIWYWEHEGSRAVRLGNWKLVASYGATWELYDVDADRTELNNLAGKFPETVKELSQGYERWAARVGVEPWDKLLEKLRAAAKKR